MFTTFARSIIVSSVCVGVVLSGTVTNDALWSIDRQTVFVGGCATLIVKGPYRNAHAYTLSIDGRPPVRLDRIGPALRHGNTTLVLLSHKLFSDDGMRVDADNPQFVHMVPLFNTPGVVRLTLFVGEDSLGTQEIKVVDAPESSQPAIDLMFPTLKRTRRGRAPVHLVMQLVMGADVSNMLKDWDDTVELLHKELQIISAHPDWSEIAAMTVGDAEATMHYKSTIKTCREAREEGRELETEPPIPPSILQALRRDVKSPFAAAIQDQIRKTIAARRWIPSLMEIRRPSRQ